MVQVFYSSMVCMSSVYPRLFYVVSYIVGQCHSQDGMESHNSRLPRNKYQGDPSSIQRVSNCYV